MGIIPFTSVPTDHPEFHNQTELSDISDEEFNQQWQEIKYKWYHRVFHVICFFLFGGPIRLLVFMPLFVLCIAIVVIVRWFQLKILKLDRMRWKKQLYFLLCVSIRFICLAFGHIHIRIKGKVDPEARFLISNHTAYHDPFVVSYVYPVSVVCKKELGDGVLKYMLDVVDAIYVTRDHAGGATKKIIEQAHNSNAAPILIFPEGTITNGDITLFFHKGAFLTEYKVQPCMLRYNQPLIPKGWNSYAWTHRSTLLYIFDCLCMPPNILDVTLLPAMSVKDADGTPEGFAKMAELKMANFLGTKATTRSSNKIFRKKKEAKAANQQNAQPQTDKPKTD